MFSEVSLWYHPRTCNLHSLKHPRELHSLRSKVNDAIRRVATREDLFGTDKSKSFEVFLTSRHRVRHGGAKQLFVNCRGDLAGRKGLAAVIAIYRELYTVAFIPLVYCWCLTSAENISFCYSTNFSIDKFYLSMLNN